MCQAAGLCEVMEGRIELALAIWRELQPWVLVALGLLAICGAAIVIYSK